MALGPTIGLLVNRGGANTVRESVAVLDMPADSAAETVNVLFPVSAGDGIPESVPEGPTLSQDGPLILANVNGSPGFGSVA